MKKDFEIVPHTADLQIRVYGTTLEGLFRNALIGMFQAIEPRTTECAYKNERLVCTELPIKHQISVDSYDQASLLVDVLSEALYLSDIHNEAYLDITIHELTTKHISATLMGVSVTGFSIEIKAVTYHDLQIKQENGIWYTNIVFDI